MAKFEIWKSANDGNYYWHLYFDRNHRIICVSEGYSTRQNAKDSIDWVRQYSPTAAIESE